tara:strand:- start:428 stop:610 length:183 start_codon:yes stop_codon:yes gene_type:complete
MRDEFLFLNQLHRQGETNMQNLHQVALIVENEYGLDTRASHKLVAEWTRWGTEDPTNLNL